MKNTKKQMGKSHEETAKLMTGLPIGSVSPAHTKHSVKDAKDNRKPHAASHAQRNAAIAGNANPMGEGSVAPYTGHAPLHNENPSAITSSRQQRESAIAGQADAEGEQPMISHHNNTPSFLK